jgi:hypothetical protein
MSKSLSNQLQQKRQELSAAQQNASSQQSQYQSTTDQLSQVLTQQVNLNDQLQKTTSNFQALMYLFDSYRKSKGITLNPSIVITKPIPAEELVHTDTLKEACKSKYQEGFDLALAKITDLDFQDSDGKKIDDMQTILARILHAGYMNMS